MQPETTMISPITAINPKPRVNFAQEQAANQEVANVPRQFLPAPIHRLALRQRCCRLPRDQPNVKKQALYRRNINVLNCLEWWIDGDSGDSKTSRLERLQAEETGLKVFEVRRFEQASDGAFGFSQLRVTV